MQILYIITQADGGGAQKYVLQMAKHFNGQIAAGDEAQKLFDDAAAAGIPAYKLKHLKRNINLWHDFFALFEIYRLVKKVKPNIVHANSSKAGLLGCIGAKLAGAKVVFTAHGFRFLEPLSPVGRIFYLWMEKIASWFRNFIIAVSDADRAAAIKNGVIAANKILTVHNGIPKIDFLPREEARKKLGLLDVHKKIVGCVANDYATKGIDILESAIGLTSYDCNAFVYGHNPKVGTTAQNGKFTYKPFVPGIAHLLKAFDVLAMPSRKEGFPFLLLEAMQAGLPIVATSVGGIPEEIADAGVLVPPENPKALADAIDKLLADEGLMKELSQKALERSKMFTEEKMYAETEAVYKKII